MSTTLPDEDDFEADAEPTGIQRYFQSAPIVPHDFVELEHIPALLDKIPEYMTKIAEMTKEVEKLGDVVSARSFENSHEVCRLIFKSFFSDLSNRAFQNLGNNGIDDVILRAKTNLVHEGLIKSRNLSCEVCGENRSSDRCHIVPRKLGGSWEANNILVLCPTHHRLIDRFMLSRAEYAAIDWCDKSAPSQHYADTVILEMHKAFWQKLEKGQHERAAEYDREHKPFVKYALIQVLNLFSEKKMLKRSAIYKVIDPELREISKKIISHLVKQNVLVRHENGKDVFYLLKPLSEPELEELALRTRQQIG